MLGPSGRSHFINPPEVRGQVGRLNREKRVTMVQKIEKILRVAKGKKSRNISILKIPYVADSFLKCCILGENPKNKITGSNQHVV